MRHWIFVLITTLFLALGSKNCHAQEDAVGNISAESAKEAVAEFNNRKADLIQKKKEAELKVTETFKVELQKLEETLLGKLEESLVLETKAGNLDQAVELRDAIRIIKTNPIGKLAAGTSNEELNKLREEVLALKRELVATLKKLEMAEVAQIEIVAGAAGIGSLRNNARAFSNRKYVWVNVAEDQQFPRVTIVAGGGDLPLVAKIKRPGWMRIAIDHGNNPSVLSYLKDNDWKPTSDQFGYSDGGPSTLYVFQKRVEPGTLTLKKIVWAGPVILLP